MESIQKLENYQEINILNECLAEISFCELISFFSSLATCTHVLIARKFVANDFNGCGNVLNTSLVLSFSVGLIVRLIGVTSALFIPFSYFIGVHLGYGLIGAWIALPVYIIPYSTAIYVKFRWGKWQTERNF
ncbi:MAG: hypothetical protein NTX22_03950 [Ignavibacteriales bacterium]|nr:hypothetical protein [Ignavibacteriales bacterium]